MKSSTRILLTFVSVFAPVVLGWYADKEKAFEADKVAAYEYAQKGECEKSMAIWEKGHQAGMFFGIPRRPEFTDLFKGSPRFASILARDSELREEATRKAVMRYEMVTPSGYSETRKYPLFIVLHGGNDRIERARTYWTSPSLGREWLVAYMQSAVPSSSTTFAWRQRDEKARAGIRKFYDEIVAKYPVDTSRVYIGGMSAGGMMSLDVVFHEVVPVAGFVVNCPVVPEDFGPAMAENMKKRGIRGVTLTGEKDWGLPRQKEMTEALAKAGASHRLAVKEGLGHEIPKDFPALLDGALTEIDLPGKKLGKVARLNVDILAHHVPIQIQTMREAGKKVVPETEIMLRAARHALDAGDSYRAYRLYMRAFGTATSPKRTSAYDAAAAFAVKLNRAIFWPSDTIEVTLAPLYDAGAVPDGLQVQLWLESANGAVPGTERTLNIREFAPQRVSYSAANLPGGTASLGVAFLAAHAEALTHVYYSFAVVPPGRPALPILREAAASVRERAGHYPLAGDTIDYLVDGFVRDTARYGGHWRREILPFAVRFGSGPERPGFWGPVRCPEDIDFAIDLIRDLKAGRDPLARRRGDMHMAIRLPDAQLMSFRIFVPEGEEQARRAALVALHSGAGDQSYFEWETFSLPEGRPYVNTFKKLAQQYGMLVVCPAGQFDGDGERGSAMIQALLDRVRSVYPIPSGRVLLTGWSVGASSAWRIAMSHPERFAGMALIAGDATWLTREATARAAKLPVLYVAGDKDFAITQAHTTRDIASRHLPLFHYKELADAGHQDTWPRGHELALQFLDETLRHP